MTNQPMLTSGKELQGNQHFLQGRYRCEQSKQGTQDSHPSSPGPLGSNMLHVHTTSQKTHAKSILFVHSVIKNGGRTPVPVTTARLPHASNSIANKPQLKRQKRASNRQTGCEIPSQRHKRGYVAGWTRAGGKGAG